MNSSSDLVSVTLEGGPRDIPRTLRVLRARVAEGKIKIERHGGYEHFERDPAAEGLAVDAGAESPVFRWTVRTRIAE
ncbi:hypothetical protein GCM10022254_31860 [Actinomadura meridiana]|uniref:Uncharacterized protein n=1 Tax=Actinomadura meridiana TaxID=559626 RepID=A0ABP8C315_9ACTN